MIGAIACADGSSRPETEAAPARMAGTVTVSHSREDLLFVCEGLELTVLHEGESLRLGLPDRVVQLPRVAAASGAKYANGTVTFWGKGEEALVEVNGRSYPGCRRRPVEEGRNPWIQARRRGVTFRASGNEPGWFLEVTELGGRTRIDVTADYGDVRAAFEQAERAGAEGGRTLYRSRSADHSLELDVEPRPCADSMSGEEFEAATTLRLDGREYRGCGRWLSGAVS